MKDRLDYAPDASKNELEYLLWYRDEDMFVWQNYIDKPIQLVVIVNKKPDENIS